MEQCSIQCHGCPTSKYYTKCTYWHQFWAWYFEHCKGVIKVLSVNGK